MEISSMEEFFTGRKLYGDDFTSDEIQKWFEEEKLGYYELGEHRTDPSDSFGYEKITILYLYNKILKTNRQFHKVLGIGSAFGEEFLPILNKIDELTILEPAEPFHRKEINGHPVTYLKPNADGIFPLKEKFDLIICFGVLHHIPNVSKILQEIRDHLVSGGFALIREPSISLGDWRKERKGVTKHERGIPIKWFKQKLIDLELKLIGLSRAMFALTGKIDRILKRSSFQTRFGVVMDWCICKIFSWNDIYHPRNFFQKIFTYLQPTAFFAVVTR